MLRNPIGIPPNSARIRPGSNGIHAKTNQIPNGITQNSVGIPSRPPGTSRTETQNARDLPATGVVCLASRLLGLQHDPRRLTAIRLALGEGPGVNERGQRRGQHVGPRRSGAEPAHQLSLLEAEQTKPHDLGQQALRLVLGEGRREDKPQLRLGSAGRLAWRRKRAHGR